MISRHHLTDITAPRLIARVHRGAVWFGPRSRRAITLTFDDGPVADSTGHILDVLDSHGVHATFFLMGSTTRRNPALAREIVARGHGIGFHGDSHVDPWKTTAGRLEKDFRIGLGAVEDITGQRPIAYRPPYGHLRPALSRLAAEHQLPIVMWDTLSGDFRLNDDQQRLAERNLRSLTPGSIIVLHDSAGQHALTQLEVLLRGIAAGGFSIAPLISYLP